MKTPSGCVRILRCLIVGIVLPSCAIMTSTLAPNGEEGASGRQRSDGWLMVFSSAEGRIDRDRTLYSLPTGYVVFHENGALCRFVPNHSGPTDETPTIIRLPAGSYWVDAQAENFGTIRVSIPIVRDRLTEVHLDGTPKPTMAERCEWVRSLDGATVGWRADRLDDR